MHSYGQQRILACDWLRILRHGLRKLIVSVKAKHSARGSCDFEQILVLLLLRTFSVNRLHLVYVLTALTETLLSGYHLEKPHFPATIAVCLHLSISLALYPYSDRISRRLTHTATTTESLNRSTTSKRGEHEAEKTLKDIRNIGTTLGGIASRHN